MASWQQDVIVFKVISTDLRKRPLRTAREHTNAAKENLALFCRIVLSCDKRPRSLTNSLFTAFSLPGQFAPRSESTNRIIGPWPIRSLELLLPGPFAPWPSRSLELSLPGPFAPRPFRSVEFSFPGTFAPLMCISPFAYTDRNVLN